MFDSDFFPADILRIHVKEVNLFPIFFCVFSLDWKVEVMISPILPMDPGLPTFVPCVAGTIGKLLVK